MAPGVAWLAPAPVVAGGHGAAEVEADARATADVGLGEVSAHGAVEAADRPLRQTYTKKKEGKSEESAPGAVGRASIILIKGAQ